MTAKVPEQMRRSSESKTRLKRDSINFLDKREAGRWSDCCTANIYTLARAPRILMCINMHSYYMGRCKSALAPSTFAYHLKCGTIPIWLRCASQYHVQPRYTHIILVALFYLCLRGCCQYNMYFILICTVTYRKYVDCALEKCPA